MFIWNVNWHKLNYTSIHINIYNCLLIVNVYSFLYIIHSMVCVKNVNGNYIYIEILVFSNIETNEVNNIYTSLSFI